MGALKRYVDNIKVTWYKNSDSEVIEKPPFAVVQQNKCSTK